VPLLPIIALTKLLHCSGGTEVGMAQWRWGPDPKAVGLPQFFAATFLRTQWPGRRMRRRQGAGQRRIVGGLLSVQHHQYYPSEMRTVLSVL